MTAPHHDHMTNPAAAGQSSMPGARPTPQPRGVEATTQAAGRGLDPLLSVRTAMVPLLAVLVGVCAGVLAALAGQSLAAATLVGGGAVGGALALFHSLIDRR